jgi:release factor glutamine methyltransferase
MLTRQVVSRLANMVSARELAQWAQQELQDHNENAALDSHLLLSEILGVSRTQVLLIDEVTAATEKRYRESVERRKTGEPIQYITGRAYFRHLEIDVGPGVLIPRPESEDLVSALIDQVKTIPHPRILDLGSGSGALALALATEINGAYVVAVEKDSHALSWLHRNIARIKSTVEVIQSDVIDFDGRGEFDAVIANPPYIPSSEKPPHEVLNFEPHLALFGGATGIELPAQFIDAAQKALKSGGYLAMEHHEQQADSIHQLLAGYFTNVQVHYDLNNRPRWSSGVRM